MVATGDQREGILVERRLVQANANERKNAGFLRSYLETSQQLVVESILLDPDAPDEVDIAVDKTNMQMKTIWTRDGDCRIH